MVKKEGQTDNDSIFKQLINVKANISKSRNMLIVVRFVYINLREQMFIVMSCI